MGDALIHCEGNVATLNQLIQAVVRDPTNQPSDQLSAVQGFLGGLSRCGNCEKDKEYKDQGGQQSYAP